MRCSLLLLLARHWTARLLAELLLLSRLLPSRPACRPGIASVRRLAAQLKRAMLATRAAQDAAVEEKEATAADAAERRKPKQQHLRWRIAQAPRAARRMRRRMVRC